MLWWSLALGADLGGNATAIGASANVVILGLAQRSGQPISFWEFTKYGAVVAVATMLVCMPYLLASLLHLRLIVAPHPISEAAQAPRSRPQRHDTLPRAAG